MNQELLEQVRDVIRLYHLSHRTEQSYIVWIYRFILFHHMTDPRKMNEKEISAFLTFLTVDKKFSASTQNQALNALLFLYKQVLKKDLGRLEYDHAEVGNHLPDALNRNEVRKILSHLQEKGDTRLMASLLFSSGLRLNECLKLRVRDVDFKLNGIIVRDNEGEKNRLTLLPRKLRSQLISQIEKSRVKLLENLTNVDFKGSSMPQELETKFPNSPKELAWQYIFPSQKLSIDPVSGNVKQHHRHGSFLQKAVKKAAIKAGITSPVSCHTFRHSFAVHLLEDGYDVHLVRELIGHKDIRTTMHYMHTLTRNKLNVRSPLDL